MAIHVGKYNIYTWIQCANQCYIGKTEQDMEKCFFFCGSVWKHSSCFQFRCHVYLASSTRTDQMPNLVPARPLEGVIYR